MNAVRDNLNFLKGALDLLTASTTADTGGATSVYIIRAAVNQAYFTGTVTGDTGPRIRLSSTAAGRGAIYFDDGTAVSGSEDTSLYSAAAGELGTSSLVSITHAATTDTALRTFVSGDTVPRFRIDSDGKHVWGAGGGTAADVTLFRSAANVLKTEDTFDSVLGYMFNGTAVVQARVTGYTAMTNTLNRATAYDSTTITLAQLASRVKAIQDDLTAHGLIGA